MRFSTISSGAGARGQLRRVCAACWRRAPRSRRRTPPARPATRRPAGEVAPAMTAVPSMAAALVVSQRAGLACDARVRGGSGADRVSTPRHRAGAQERAFSAEARARAGPAPTVPGPYRRRTASGRSARRRSRARGRPRRRGDSGPTTTACGASHRAGSRSADRRLLAVGATLRESDRSDGEFDSGTARAHADGRQRPARRVSSFPPARRAHRSVLPRARGAPSSTRSASSSFPSLAQFPSTSGPPHAFAERRRSRSCGAIRLRRVDVPKRRARHPDDGLAGDAQTADASRRSRHARVPRRRARLRAPAPRRAFLRLRARLRRLGARLRAPRR